MLFRLSIESGRSFIQQQKPRLPNERSSDRKPLLLTSTKRVLGDLRLEAVLEGLDEVAPCFGCGFFDLGLGGDSSRLAVGDVFESGHQPNEMKSDLCFSSKRGGGEGAYTVPVKTIESCETSPIADLHELKVKSRMSSSNGSQRRQISTFLGGGETDDGKTHLHRQR